MKLSKVFTSSAKTNLVTLGWNIAGSAGIVLDTMDRVISSALVTSVVNMISVALTLLISGVIAQDDFGGDDAGADMDLESMMGGDGGGGDGGDPSLVKKMKPKSFLEETTLALQQLGLIIGVAFMVAFLFMVMIGVEKMWEKVGEKYQEITGKNQPEEKDPASLVGTFSRYK